MKCLHCGQENPDNTKFCSNCGNPLNVNPRPIPHPNQQYNTQQSQQNPFQQPQQPVIVKQKKKKGCLTIGLIVLGVIVLLGIIGMIFGNNNDSDTTTSQKNIPTSVTENNSKTEDPTTSQESGVYILGDIKLKFISSKVVKEEYGDSHYLIVNFDYTNNSSDTKAFDECVTVKAFQSGVELQSPISTYGIPDYDFHYSEKEVKPGVTLTVQEAFRLDDLNNSVSIELYDGVFFISEPDYEFEINIK